MAEVRDILHPSQVKLFDSLDQLRSLKVEGRIQPPELIVVGGQSCGKSSVLEALVRSSFPIHEGLCTRFPIKLILRRDTEERCLVSIETSELRSIEESATLKSRIESISEKDLGMIVKKASDIIGVYSGITDSMNGNPSPSGGQNSKEFNDEVLVIRKYGPGLPVLSLVDLPGLFAAESVEQGEESKRKVAQMVQKHIKLKRSVVMLVVSAGTSYSNNLAPQTIQDIMKHDFELRDRVVGIITHPDTQEISEEIFKLLNGRLDKIQPKGGWLALRNLSITERAQPRSLDTRDEKESAFFSTNSKWKLVPEKQKGIAALRVTLRDMLWTRTKAELPSIISEVKNKIEIIESRLRASQSRATDFNRRLYLGDIAKTFERLTQEAVRGAYEDKPCNKPHSFDETCPNCKVFFPLFGDNSLESQDTRLRANVRALNKAFATALRRFGKTKVIYDGSITPYEADDQSDFSETFLSEHVIRKHYTYSKSESTSREEFERDIAKEMERWRAREPKGEASEATYFGLFEYQSRRWRVIATNHLKAIWNATETFVNKAMAAACADEDVLQALRKHLIAPRLDKLQRQAHLTLNNLLNCHGRGKTGFYDGFVDIVAVKGQARGFTGQQFSSVPNSIEPEQGSELAEIIQNVFSGLLISQLNPLMASSPIGGVLSRKICNLIIQAISSSSLAIPRDLTEAATQVFQSMDGATAGNKSNVESNNTTGIKTNVTGNKSGGEGKTVRGKGTSSKNKETGDEKDGRAVRRAVFDLYPQEIQNIAAAQVIEQVETYYEMSMVSFVGYVNSLVVESGILDKLPDAVFSQQLIMGEDEKLIKDIAGVKEADAQKREQDLKDLNSLNTILGTLEEYLDEAQP
ncbi:P-loop containing nucleoside triphosphate hydrolase protein [Xylogone sp. PMI_703]|nr:P-loop containing nucleoside triphosphate hydrolase protein [Xylogone sp. PMI_703]